MELRGRNGTRRATGAALFALIGATIFGVGTAAAVADTSGANSIVQVAPPASNDCAGPGCTTGKGQVTPFVQLLASGPGCADGGACFWVQSDFDGDKVRVDDVPCCTWFGLTQVDRFRSARNRYLNRKVQTGNAQNQTSCMDPGENRSDLDPSDRFKLGVAGSRCD